MKINFHYHFYSKIFISLLIFSFGFFLLQKSVDTRALIPNVYQGNTPIVGWAWNDKMGWIALNCANDFDGDGVPDGDYVNGTDSCSPTKWGLKMAIESVDHDNNASTPNIALNYVQGCAWAGGVAQDSGGDPVTSPGWICFSNPGNTAAPANGVLMSTEEVDIRYCQCVMTEGMCDGTVAPSNTACTNYTLCSGLNANWPTNNCVSTTGKCSVTESVSCSVNSDCPKWGNDCVNGACYNSGTACTQDADCQYACRNDSDPYFLLKGICYDYTNNTPAQQQILNNLRGTKPPFSTGDAYLHTCYIDKDCYDASNPANAGHPNGECVYPQLADRGQCKNASGTLQAGPVSCTYDFDCDRANGYFCGFSVPNSWMSIPESCDSNICRQGYEPQEETLSATAYTNALNPQALDQEGYASIVRMEAVTTTPGYSEANKLGFPIQFPVRNTAFGVEDPDYDVDNPNLGTAGDNPIRGCFNCYREKKYQCLSGAQCSCDQGDNSCIDALDRCEDGPDGPDTCVVYDLGSPVCENCQEYFYYSSPQSTCRSQPDKTCTSNADCDNYFSDQCVAHSAGDLKKVLTGFNCTECTVDSYTNSCSLNAQGTNNNRCNRCQSVVPQSDGSTLVTSNVYRNGGVLYDNQHGRSAIGALCGWGYNSYSGNPFDSGIEGFGWFNFSPRISTSTKPYFSVEKGNIYSKGSIFTRYQPPVSKYNASYLIESNGSITNFVSNLSQNAGVQSNSQNYQGELPNRPLIDFLSPLATGKYQNALGKLDYKGLITTARTSGALKYNKYGSRINTLTQAQFENAVDAIFATPLDNQVFYVERDNNLPYVQISGSGPDLEVKVGDNTHSGSGIIVVNGTLKIEKNITYESSSAITNLKQIPSLVWIIKGDVEIDPDVTELAGTFIVLGRDGLNCYTINPSDRATQHCGQFLSVHYDTSQNSYPGLANASFLKVSGNVLARKFVLVRRAVDPVAGLPAEQFINDGRLQSNPPAGLTDFSRVIPRFSSY